MDIYGNFGRPYNQFNTMQNSAYNGNYQPMQAPIQQPIPQLRTNKVFVTSLEDALSRYAEPNTIMIYRHQDEKFEYEIMTDAQGKKTYKTLELKEYSVIAAEKETKTDGKASEEINSLKGRISVLEEKIKALATTQPKPIVKIEPKGV